MNLTAAEHRAFGEARRKSYESQVEVKSFNEKDYTVEVVVTTVSIDRELEVVLPSAIAKRLEVYMSNPKLLWNHKRNGSPKNALGKCLSLTPLPGGEGWVAVFQYDVDINKRAAKVWNQIVKGTLKSWSISFLPWAWVTRLSKAEELEQLPPVVRGWLMSGQCKVVYTDVEIIEISNVHVPSNRDAILRRYEEQIAMENQGSAVEAVSTPAPQAQEKAAAAVVAEAALTPEAADKALAAKVKYHPKVNDIAGRLRMCAYSLEGPGWDDYDGESMPEPERVSACLDILSEIQASLQGMVSKAASAPEPVAMAVTAEPTEKAAAETPEPVLTAEPEPVAKGLAESGSRLKPFGFDRVAAAKRYLETI